MRHHAVVQLVLAGAVTAGACGGTGSAGRDAASDPGVPDAVTCTDGPRLRERALSERRLRAETRSDQERIVTGSRATFYASLAIIADLKCQGTSAEADEALKPAFDAARKAQATNSFYQRAVWWGEAGYLATQAVPLLMQPQPATGKPSLVAPERAYRRAAVRVAEDEPDSDAVRRPAMSASTSITSRTPTAAPSVRTTAPNE